MGMDTHVTFSSVVPSGSATLFSSHSCKCHEHEMSWRSQDRDRDRDKAVNSLRSSASSKEGGIADKHVFAMLLCRVILGLYEPVETKNSDGSSSKPSVHKDTGV